MIRIILCLFASCLLVNMGWSDTIGNYQKINKSIPKMEIKADEQSQAWARSARHVLTITNESIAETLLALNEQSAKQGRPFFCLPSQQTLTANDLAKLIEEMDQQAKPSAPIGQRTVSQVALEAVMKKYPCQAQGSAAYSALSGKQARMKHSQAMP